MADEQISDRIETLVKEEHALLERAESSHGLDEEAHARMQQVQVELDQCWDLLRQRRARRSAGQNPDDSSLRTPDTVEHYLQ
jgi:predicted nuclease with TOPRIM domain